MLEYLEWDGRGGDIARMPQNIDTPASLQSLERNINIIWYLGLGIEFCNLHKFDLLRLVAHLSSSSSFMKNVKLYNTPWT